MIIAGMLFKNSLVQPFFRRSNRVGHFLIRRNRPDKMQHQTFLTLSEWACLNWNAPSIAFYRKMGAFPMSDWTTWRMTAKDIPQKVENVWKYRQNPTGAPSSSTISTLQACCSKIALLLYCFMMWQIAMTSNGMS